MRIGREMRKAVQNSLPLRTVSGRADHQSGSLHL
jgi:hypothetical protein